MWLEFRQDSRWPRILRSDSSDTGVLSPCVQGLHTSASYVQKVSLFEHIIWTCSTAAHLLQTWSKNRRNCTHLGLPASIRHSLTTPFLHCRQSKTWKRCGSCANA